MPQGMVECVWVCVVRYGFATCLVWGMSCVIVYNVCVCACVCIVYVCHIHTCSVCVCLMCTVSVSTVEVL